MKAIQISSFLALLSCLLAYSTKQKPEITSIKVKQIAENLTGPVAMDCPHDASGRLFICEQTGKIKIIKNEKLLDKPFFDITSKLDAGNKFYSEKGLLGLSFHPEFKSNGRFFLYYSAPSNVKGSDHKSILAEYKVSAKADYADMKSEKILMEIEQPESNHNGGQLAFGPDGNLYIGLGDGGGAGDAHGILGNGQDLTTWLGKILRIQVDNLPEKNKLGFYAIPKDNPFVTINNAKPEIWAYGLRNPWRFSFDTKTGKLFCADVGQDKFEEVDIIKKGENYGWRVMEASHCFEPDKNCKQHGLVLPIAEYPHSTGVCVTGGYVYRGIEIPYLQGKYVFGDWKGKLFYLEEKAGKWHMKDLLLSEVNSNDAAININSFGEDENGELYILGQKNTGTIHSKGVVYKINGK